MGSGRRGTPPVIGAGDPCGFADPLAQAFALTAIVISFGVSALLLALSYRSWILTGKDEVEDDVADRAIASGGHHDKEITDEEEWHEEDRLNLDATPERSEEHTSELQSLMRISYAVFCLKQKKAPTSTYYHYNVPHGTPQNK